MWRYLHGHMLSSVISQKTVGQLISLRKENNKLYGNLKILFYVCRTHYTVNCAIEDSISPVHITVMLGNRSSPTVCRYGDLDTLGEHREPQYSTGREKELCLSIKPHEQFYEIL